MTPRGGEGGRGVPTVSPNACYTWGRKGVS